MTRYLFHKTAPRSTVWCLKARSKTRRFNFLFLILLPATPMVSSVMNASLYINLKGRSKKQWCNFFLGWGLWSALTFTAHKVAFKILVESIVLQEYKYVAWDPISLGVRKSSNLLLISRGNCREHEDLCWIPVHSRSHNSSCCFEYLQERCLLQQYRSPERWQRSSIAKCAKSGLRQSTQVKTSYVRDSVY